MPLSIFFRLPLKELEVFVVFVLATAPSPSVTGEQDGFIDGGVAVSVRASSLLSTTVRGFLIKSFPGEEAEVLVETKFDIQLCVAAVLNT